MIPQLLYRRYSLLGSSYKALRGQAQLLDPDRFAVQGMFMLTALQTRCVAFLSTCLIQQRLLMLFAMLEACAPNPAFNCTFFSFRHLYLPDEETDLHSRSEIHWLQPITCKQVESLNDMLKLAIHIVGLQLLAGCLWHTPCCYWRWRYVFEIVYITLLVCFVDV